MITDETTTAKKTQKLITQEYYDETVLENEEMFEWDSNKAVYETIEELKSQNVCLDNIITLHPNSRSGKDARDKMSSFRKLVTKELDDITKRIGVNDVVEQQRVLKCFDDLKQFVLDKKREEKTEVETSTEEGNFEIDFLELFVKLGGIQSLMILITSPNPTESIISESIQFLIPCLQSKKSKREIQSEMTGFIHDCMGMLREYPLLIKLLNLACQGNEKNKVTTMTNDPNVIISLLEDTSSNQSYVCQLISSLCRYDDPSAVTSSAHQNVLSFVNSNLLDPLFTIMKSALQRDRGDVSLCSTIMTTFRTLSINDEIIQQLIEKGILLIINQTFILAFQSESLQLARANLGIVRNMCQNDDVKCIFCNEYLKMLLEVTSTYTEDYVTQEHFCSIVGAMALRYPSNAKKIIFETNAVECIITAMKRYPQNVTLQRQACLAIRNLVCRDDTPDKSLSHAVLDLGAEEVLKEAGMFLGSVDEAYAALRDLGCENVSLLRVDKETGEVHVGVEMFGQVKSGFRATYEQSNNL